MKCAEPKVEDWSGKKCPRCGSWIHHRESVLPGDVPGNSTYGQRIIYQCGHSMEFAVPSPTVWRNVTKENFRQSHKLAQEKKDRLRELILSGRSQARIAEEMGLSRVWVCQVSQTMKLINILAMVLFWRR